VTERILIETLHFPVFFRFNIQTLTLPCSKRSTWYLTEEIYEFSRSTGLYGWTKCN